jgi:SAM-dependent methyltransferase
MDNINTNKDFWDELCGTHLFQFLGLKEINRESLKIFDNYYLNMYPYLKKHVPIEVLKNTNTLEIGLGFGTLSQYIFENAAQYTGIDYAKNPVELVNHRAEISRNTSAKAIQGDAKNLPFPDSSFDIVVSIGCLHHTGDTAKSVSEVHRVLKNNGTAIIMLYNKNSFRRLAANPYKFFVAKRKKTFKNFDEYTRGSYDANIKGEAAPVVDFYSKKEIKKIFGAFTLLKIKSENFDNYHFHLFKKEVYWPREKFLNNIAKIMGLDLYITAKK